MFGGAKLTAREKWYMKCLDVAMYWQCFLLPVIAFGLIWFSKYQQTCGDYGSNSSIFCLHDNGDPTSGQKNVGRFIYVIISFWGGFLQIFTAGLLVYAMIKIRIILGKHGLTDRINIRMFIINASLFLFQMVSLCVWYWKFYWYTNNYYAYDCANPATFTGWTIPQCNGGVPLTDVDGSVCNTCRATVRTIAVKWWLGSNTANFIA